MDPRDTGIGGSNRRFLTTNWSQILAAGDPAHPRHRQEIERLAQIYWKPVYLYIRAAWRKTNEDAKDLTQAFFAYLLGKEYLSRMRPERGSFRAYLRVALSHFLVDADRHQKVRTPQQPVIRIDTDPEVLESLGPVSEEESPDEAFDREWFRGVISESIEDLREFLERQNKRAYFEVFRDYCLEKTDEFSSRRTTQMLRDDPATEPTYEGIAAQRSLHKHDVRNYLAYCRAELIRILRERVRGYVANDEDVENELEEILRA